MYAVLLATVFALVTMLPLAPLQGAQNQNIKVLIHGQEISSKVQPVISEGRVLLPMRVIFEALGMEVKWDGKTKTAHAIKTKTDILVQVGNKTAQVNSKPVQLDVAATIINDSTMIPIRFAAEAVGEEVVWDEKNRAVYIGTNTLPEQQTQSQESQNQEIGNLHYISGSKLVEDTALEYAAGKTVTGKANTKVEFYKSGYLQKVIIAADTQLEFTAGKTALFRAGSEITFSEQGYVVGGTLANPTELEYAADKKISFKAAPIAFNSKGYVTEGVLIQDENLRFQDNISTLFQKDKTVSFYSTGSVHRGTIRRDAHIQYGRDVLSGPAKLDNTDGQYAYCAAGTEVSFYPNGLLEQGTLLQNTSLPYSFSMYIVFKAGTNVCFGSNSYIQKGIIRDNEHLPYKSDKFLDAEWNKPVEFNQQGLLSKAVLLYDTSLEYRYDKPLVFAAGTEVSFDNDSFVKKGILKNSEKVYFNNAYQTLVRGGQTLEFRDDNYIKTCTLGDDLNFHYGTYLAGTLAEFNNNGEVIRGVLTEGTRMPYADDQWIVCKEGMEVALNGDGYLMKGTLRDSTSLPYCFDKTNSRIVTLKADTIFTLTSRGFVQSGILASDTMFDYREGEATLFKANTLIEFYENGMAKSGTVKDDAVLSCDAHRSYKAAAGTKVFFDTSGYLERIE